MEFRSSTFNQEGEVVDIRGLSYARFVIDNETAKLRILVSVKAGDFFDADDVAIEAITIWPIKDPKHLDYFHDLRLTLDNGDIVRGPVFSHLDIDFENDKPVRLSGTWYDLDGAFAKGRKDFWMKQHGTVRGELSLRGRILFRRLDESLTSASEKLLQHSAP
jgi:hypothetical protein